MICGNCGTWIEDGKTNCPNCGAAVMPNGAPQPGMNDQPMMDGQPMAGGQPMMNDQPMMSGQPGMGSQPMMNKKEFYKHPNMSKVRKEIIACGVVWYVLAGFNFLIQIVYLQYIPGLLDVALMLGLGLGVHLGKSRVCAIILTAYAVFNTVILLMAGGGNGALILIAAIFSLVYTFKFQNAWKRYQKTGVIPAK